MPDKYQIITELAVRAAREIASGGDRYADFLVTAANNYKYGFRDQLLIYAQKPDATACAGIEVWNRLGRWVNKGTKSISLLADRGTRYGLRHVFDISDTNSYAGRTVSLWRMRSRYEAAVAESLRNDFGEAEGADDFSAVLAAVSKNVADDNISDYLAQLDGVKAGSRLEGADGPDTEARLRELLQKSVAFMALTRAGCDASRYFSGRDFDGVCDFNTERTFSVLGAAVSDIKQGRACAFPPNRKDRVPRRRRNSRGKRRVHLAVQL